MTRIRRGQVHTLVDAHNAIHADASLRALAADPVAARAALAQRLDGLARVHVVCDGGPGGVAGAAIHGTLTILYSGASSADDRIVEWLRDRPTACAVVVSDDRELAARARALGARVVSCRAYLRGVRARAVAQGDAEADPRRGPPAAHEVEEWMRTFGIDEEGTPTA